MAVRGPAWRVIGGGFDGSSIPASIVEEVPIGTLNGVNTVFKLSFVPYRGFLQLFVNGNEQNKFVPRYSLSGNVITFAVAPKSDDEMYCWYFKGPAGASVLKARNFVNASDAVNWGNAATYRIPGSVSFGSWVKLPSNAQGIIVSQGHAFVVNLGYELGVSGSSGSWDLPYAHGYGTGGPTAETHTFTAGIPNDVWKYVGFSRDTALKTVNAFLGDGVNISLLGTFVYTNQPQNGPGADSSATLEIGNYNNAPGTLPEQVHFIGSIQQHYLWNRAISISEHAAAMIQNPPASGLILSCTMGDTPEVDVSPTGSTGTVTGTTLVQGHN